MRLRRLWLLSGLVVPSACNAIIGNAYVDPAVGGDAESSTFDAAPDARDNGEDAATGDGSTGPDAPAVREASVGLDASEASDATTIAPDARGGPPGDATSPPPDVRPPPAGDGGSDCDAAAGFGVCSGVCVDLENDPQNCGICAHGCQGGTCQFGECPVVSVASGTDLSALVVDSSGVYWADPGAQAIYHCALGGCAQGPDLVSTLTPNDRMVVDATNVYFANARDILSCAKSGCGDTPVTLATTTQPIVGVAAAGGNVFWSTNDGSIWECPATGCAAGPTMLAASQGAAEDLVSDGNNLYWVNPDFNQLLFCSVRGCAQAPTVLSSSPTGDVGGMSIAGGFSQLVLTSSALYVLIVDSTMLGYIGKLPLTGAGQSPAVVVSSLMKPVAFAVDSAGIYFRDDELGIGRTNLDGTGVTTFAFVNSIRSVAADIGLDPTFVYWISTNGVNKIAK